MNSPLYFIVIYIIISLMSNKDLFQTIIEKTSSGEDVVLATIISESGSSPRSSGAHIVVSENGRVCGTIGGGKLEYSAVQIAQNAVKERKSLRKKYLLQPSEEVGMFCGGGVEVFFQYISADDEKTLSLLQKCVKYLEERDEDLWFFIELTDGNEWTMDFYGAGFPLTAIELEDNDIKTLTKNKAFLREINGRIIYSEIISFSGKVFLFGAGHVVQALQPLLSSVDFRCVIFDNRPDFLNPNLFHGAYDLIAGDYEHISEKIQITEKDFIVVSTYDYDLPVLRQIINCDYAYLGLMGSKNKVALFKEKLSAEGVSREKLESMNAPIGLAIYSETPQEIAVSIAGELIRKRAELRQGQCL